MSIAPPKNTQSYWNLKTLFKGFTIELRQKPTKCRQDQRMPGLFEDMVALFGTLVILQYMSCTLPIHFVSKHNLFSQP